MDHELKQKIAGIIDRNGLRYLSNYAKHHIDVLKKIFLQFIKCDYPVHIASIIIEYIDCSKPGLTPFISFLVDHLLPKYRDKLLEVINHTEYFYSGDHKYGALWMMLSWNSEEISVDQIFKLDGIYINQKRRHLLSFLIDRDGVVNIYREMMLGYFKKEYGVNAFGLKIIPLVTHYYDTGEMGPNFMKVMIQCRRKQSRYRTFYEEAIQGIPGDHENQFLKRLYMLGTWINPDKALERVLFIETKSDQAISEKLNQYRDMISEVGYYLGSRLISGAGDIPGDFSNHITTPC